MGEAVYSEQCFFVMNVLYIIFCIIFRYIILKWALFHIRLFKSTRIGFRRKLLGAFFLAFLGFEFADVISDCEMPPLPTYSEEESATTSFFFLLRRF